jgi:hypothetical protein
MAEFVISSYFRDNGHNAHFEAISVMQCCWKEEEAFAVFRKETAEVFEKRSEELIISTML